MIRVGFGVDVHRLVEGRDLWIGGIRIPYEKGLDGHSDADVLIHAICDALLGAANLRDIGYQFPDTSGEFKNIDSKILLRRTNELLKEKGYRIGNIDATVAAQAPKLNPHIPTMQRTMAQWLCSVAGAMCRVQFTSMSGARQASLRRRSGLQALRLRRRLSTTS